jgi:osmotically-inducible protein OsmY
MKRTHLAAALAALVLTLGSQPLFAQQPQAKDLTSQFTSVQVKNLRATEIGGIVVLRGDTESARSAAAATAQARTLGYTRIANLIRVVEPPDDAKIERTAERQLATRALDGCSFQLDSDGGVLHVGGTVKYELQKDVAVSLLRNIDGVREVRASLQR